MDQNTIEALIGDMSVSEQIGAAMVHVATKDHVHSEYAFASEVEDLKKKIEALMDLVGDTSVADQISAALNNIK